MIKRIASVLGATLLFTIPGCAVQSTDTQEQVQTIEPEKVEVYNKLWQGRNFTETETIVLQYLQDYGITDKYALATILGNIKQESRFEPTICEGGARTGYRNCHYGGFGLVQWTTTQRYLGLGLFADRQQLDPNQLTTQLRYMTSEIEWQQVAHIFRAEGDTIDGYMRAAKFWLGWGVHGNRTTYAYDYLARLHK